MRRHLANATTGILDYASYPIGLLLVAPMLLKHLGTTRYGIWTIAMAAVSTGGILASGLGDAQIQLVATLRGAGNQLALERAIRSAFGLNLALGLLMMVLGLLVSPALARQIVSEDAALQAECLRALQVACALMLVRAIESVSISTLRAFEHYVAAVQVSILSRLVGLASGALLAWRGAGPAANIAVTGMILAVGAAFQFWRLKVFLGGASLRPSFHRGAVRALFGFGLYSWLQMSASLLFGQVDRVLVGMTLGAAAVTSYALCVQMAQPVYGMTAAGLHFLFPYLTGHSAGASARQLRSTLLKALGANLAFATIGVGLLLLFGTRLLLAWAGTKIGAAASAIFPRIVFGSGLLALSVTGTYALLAFGRVRISALLTVLSCLIAVGLMRLLLPSRGVQGFATARLAYGAISLLVYIPLAAIIIGGVKKGERVTVLSPVEEA